MAIEAVTFDFWSTLYSPNRSSHSSRLLCIQSGLSAVGIDDIAEPQISEGMKQAWIVWDQVWREEQRTLGAADWLSLVLEHLGVELPSSSLASTVHALQTASLDLSIAPAEGSAAMLARLAPSYRLGVISDTGATPGWVLRSMMERDGLLHHIEHLVFSDEFGQSKPHRAVFLAMLDRLDARPGEAVHVGDLRRTDVAGARGVGMGTVRYAGIRDDRDEAYPDADVVIRSHGDLESVLENWSRQA